MVEGCCCRRHAFNMSGCSSKEIELLRDCERGKEEQGEQRRAKEAEGEQKRGKDCEGEARRGKDCEGVARRGKERKGEERRAKERKGKTIWGLLKRQRKLEHEPQSILFYSHRFYWLRRRKETASGRVAWKEWPDVP